MENNSDQWNSYGKCSICRRKNYCGNPCKACKNRREYELRCITSQVLFKALNKK